MLSNHQIRDQFLAIAKKRELSKGTIYRYRRWIRKFLEFHDGIALAEAELEEFEEFMESLKGLSTSTQHQARNALDFLFRDVLIRNLNTSIVRPKKYSWFSRFRSSWRLRTRKY